MKNKLRAIKGYLVNIYRNFRRDNCIILAGSISFYSLLSLIPFFLVLIALVGFLVGSSEKAISLTLEHSATLLPPALVLDFQTLIHSVISARGYIGGIGLFLLVWMAGLVFDVIEKSINHIWGVEKKRSFLRRRGITYLVMTLISICLLLSILASSIARILTKMELNILNLNLLQNQFLWKFVFFIVPLTLIIIVFIFIYNIVPNRHVPFKMSLIGGIFAGVLWVIAKRVFDIYVVKVAMFSKVFGTISTLVAIMLWVYYSSIILLLGAEIIATGMKWKEKHTGLFLAEGF
ncbi:YihY/virulence factor BrkB family protein [bacterium]|nr:YihY/virulence factor BrkB family protein [bacterium]